MVKTKLVIRTLGTVLFDFGCFILKMVLALCVVFGILAAMIKFPTAIEIVWWTISGVGVLIAGLLLLFYLSDVYNQHDRKNRHGN